MKVVDLTDPWPRIPEGTATEREIRNHWCSLDHFLSHGLGYCLVRESEVVTHCLTTSCDGGEHNIGIITFRPEDRGRGYATLAAAAFIDGCLARGWRPIWKADLHNKPSIQLAEKLGFRKVREYPDYWFTI